MTSPFVSDREAVCPPNLIDLAQGFAPPRVAIARAAAPLPMEAAEDATKAGIMIPVFVGERDVIQAEADKLNWDISGYALHDTKGEEEAGMTAARLCGEGEADVLMKGQLHTDVFMKSAVNRDNGLRTGKRRKRDPLRAFIDGRQGTGRLGRGKRPGRGRVRPSRIRPDPVRESRRNQGPDR